VPVAISKKIMLDISKDGKSIVEILIPESVNVAGILPDGFAVGE
jgi:hypothetical protein